MPAGVQHMSTINGQVYAVNAGNNNTGLLYNKADADQGRRQDALAPKNWQEILQVAAAG